MKKKFGMALRVALAALFAFALAACTDSYETTTLAEENANNNNHALFEADAVGSWLISQAQLHAWILNNHITTDNVTGVKPGQKVVIVDVNTLADNATGRAGFIPRTVTTRDMLNRGGSNVGQDRSDGPFATANQVVEGEHMDNFLRWAGIDANTVIVITTDGWGSNVPAIAARGFWNFYYWGFPKSNLKLLNGGTTGYVAEYGVGTAPGQAVGITYAPTAWTYPNTNSPTTFSVRELQGNRIDRARAAFGDVYAAASDGSFVRKDKVIVNTMGSNARYGDGTWVNSSGAAFRGAIRGAYLVNATGNSTNPLSKNNGNGYFIFASPTDDSVIDVFKDRNTLETIFPNDMNAVIWTHCGGGQSTQPFWFFLLEMGYRNAGVYDGSASEWFTVSAFRAAQGVTTATAEYIYQPTNAGAGQWLRWNNDFFRIMDTDVEVNNTVIVPSVRFDADSFFNRWDTARVSNFVSFVQDWTINTGVFNFEYTGDGREINKGDRAYQENVPVGGDDGRFEGGASAGC